MALAIDFRLLMHYISPMENNYSGRADSLSMKALCRRFKAFMQTALVAEIMAGDYRRSEELQRNFPPWRVPDVYMGILFPVRKSLTKKSGIIGLPTCASQDSLVHGERG
jgi:hypothetical protein